MTAKKPFDESKVVKDLIEIDTIGSWDDLWKVYVECPIDELSESGKILRRELIDFRLKLIKSFFKPEELELLINGLKVLNNIWYDNNNEQIKGVLNKIQK